MSTLTTSTISYATGTISFDFQVVKNEAGPSTLQITSNLNATTAPNNNILRGDSAQNNNILRGDSAQNNTLVVPMCLSPNHVVQNGTTHFPLEGSDNTPLLWNLTLDEFPHDEPQTYTTPSLSADIESFLPNLSSKELEEIKHMTDSEFNGLFNDTDMDADVLEVDDEQHRHTKASPEAAKVSPEAAAAAAGATSGSDNTSNDDDDGSSESSIHSSDDDDDSDDDEAKAVTANPHSHREQPARTPSIKRLRKCKAPSRSTILAPRHPAQVATMRAGCSKCRFSKRGCNSERCSGPIDPNGYPNKKKFLRFKQKHPAQKW